MFPFSSPEFSLDGHHMSPVESPSYPEEANGYSGHQDIQEGAPGYEGYAGKNGQTNGTSPQVKKFT